MCQSATPQEPAASPSAQTFATTEEFLAAIKPGMELCTSDFTGWAEVERVVPGSPGSGAVIVGTRREDGRAVAVPADVLIDLRGGHCIRVDRVRATIDSQGWEAPEPAPVNR